MPLTLQTKRRRGGQPGNKNAHGNRGNLCPCPNFGNRGGGAPLGNANARKQRRAPHLIILDDYRNDAEAAAWILAHADQLREAAFAGDDERDRALYDGYRGLTPETLVDQGLEFRLGAYTRSDFESGGAETTQGKTLNDRL